MLRDINDLNPFFRLGSSAPLSPQPSVSLTKSTPTSEAVSVDDSDILAEVFPDVLDSVVGTDSDASTNAKDSVDVSFVFKTNLTKIKLDCRLLSGICMESAVPLEDGLNVDTLGVVFGKRVGKDIL